ncbi:MAG: carbohydrate ABC transporter permease [Thermomicrobiales bacterium]|nr:carbohydrate ABC transporter permease [Thermomicrobiales bacterium]
MARGVRRGLFALLVVGILAIVVVPFLWILLASFQPNRLLIQPSPRFSLAEMGLSNYENLQQAAQYFTYLRNSAVVALFSTLISLILAVLAAYSVYRLDYRGRQTLLRLLLITYVFPGVLLLIPLYQIFGRLNLIDNLLSLVIVNVTFAAPFCVWLLRGFFGAIPEGIEEAAALDGAGRMRILLTMIVPLTAPGLAATAIYTFILSWTEYMFASAFIIDETRKTLPVGLGAFIAQYYVDWGILAAAAIATAAPVVILFAFVGRYFVRGLTAGSGK